jgi:hypothetical protein
LVRRPFFLCLTGRHSPTKLRRRAGDGMGGGTGGCPMRATRKHLRTAAAGVSAALLLLVVACGKSEENKGSSSAPATAPATGGQTPAANPPAPTAPAPEQPKKQ